MKTKNAPIVGLDLGLDVPVGTPCKIVVWSLGNRLTVRGLVTHHKADAYGVVVDTCTDDNGLTWHIHAKQLWVPVAAVAGDDGK